MHPPARLHTWNFYGAIVYLLNELLPLLSGCFSLGPSWSSLPLFSMATSPNLPAALPPKCNQEMHFRLRWRICYCSTAPSSYPKHMVLQPRNSKNVEVETDRNRCWKLNIENWQMWSMLGLIYMHIFLTDLRTLKWLFAQLTGPTHSAAIMKKNKIKK